jgi:hypothetical protein
MEKVDSGQFKVESKQTQKSDQDYLELKTNFRLSTFDCGLLFLAAVARRNRIPVRASFWMAEECADALIELGADDVLEFAGLIVSF